MCFGSRAGGWSIWFLTKCGICRSSGAIAFFSSERNFVGASLNWVLNCGDWDADNAEWLLSTLLLEPSWTKLKWFNRACSPINLPKRFMIVGEIFSVSDVSFRLAFPFLNLSTMWEILHWSDVKEWNPIRLQRSRVWWDWDNFHRHKKCFEWSWWVSHGHQK